MVFKGNEARGTTLKICENRKENFFYTSYIKYIIDDEWYEFDDKDISKININNINKNNIYMLFYHKI